MTPLPDESLLGYLKRRSDAEGFSEVGGYLALIGVRYGRSDFSAPETLSERLKLDPEILDEMLPRARAKDPALDWAFHRMHRDPVCPKCIAEGLPRRREWRHATVSACAIHEVRLIDECPECGEALSIDGDGHNGCLCGARYGDVPSSPASAVEVEVSRFMAGQEAELAGVSVDPIRDRQAPRTLWFLATGMTEGRMGKPGKSRLPKTVCETRNLIEPLERILMDWPKTYHVHVTARWHAPEAEGVTAAQRLGSWYRGLLAQRGILSEALLTECLQVAAHTCGDAYKLGHVEGESEWMSATEAGRSLAMRADRLVEAVNSGALNGRQSRSGTGHRHTVIRARDVDAIRHERRRLIGKTDAREFLGVSRKQFELLQASGAIPSESTARWPSLVDGNIDVSRLRDAVTAIRATASEVHRTGADTALVAFRKLNLKRTTDRTALLNVFRKIFDGEIQPVEFAPDALLADAMFNTEDVDVQLKRAGAARSWSAGEVARITGWKPEVVAHWCENGLLRADRGRRGALATWQINEQDLSDFQTRYSVVADLARGSGTSSRNLLKRLSNAGIPTQGSKTVGSTSRGHLVRTSDLLGLGGQ